MKLNRVNIELNKIHFCKFEKFKGTKKGFINVEYAHHLQYSTHQVHVLGNSLQCSNNALFNYQFHMGVTRFITTFLKC